MTTGAGLRIGSLFSGIGGLELGLEWAGVGRTVWQCEINSWCRNILQRHWPQARRYEDVRSLCIENQPAPVDVICAGFPCQDISVAGHQAGLAGKKSGLFYEIIRLLRILRPRYVVLENVANITAMPRVIGAVLSELHQSGYDGEWSIVSAAQVGAPHLRKRWFFIGWRRMADTDSKPNKTMRGQYANGKKGGCVGGDNTRARQGAAGWKRPNGQPLQDKRYALADSCKSRQQRHCRHKAIFQKPRWKHKGQNIRESALNGDSQIPESAVANTHSINRQWWSEGQQEFYSDGRSITKHTRVKAYPPKPRDLHMWQDVPVDYQPAICRGADGVSQWLGDINRVEVLRALGNAVVPQCAEVIGQRLLEIYQQQERRNDTEH